MSKSNTITVLVVDDHPVVRDGLRAIISSEPDLEIVGDVGTGCEGVDAYFALRPAVVVMDLLLPDIGGAEGYPANLPAGVGRPDHRAHHRGWR